jgi:hypothetical protein
MAVGLVRRIRVSARLRRAARIYAAQPGAILPEGHSAHPVPRRDAPVPADQGPQTPRISLPRRQTGDEVAALRVRARAVAHRTRDLGPFTCPSRGKPK